MNTNIEASVIILENNKKEILLLKRNYEPFGWCLPGGKYDKTSEGSKNAVIRELKEETGISIIDAKFLKTDVSQNGMIVHVFFAQINQKTVQISKEHSHYIWSNELLSELPLAGRTKSFLLGYKFDKEMNNENAIIPFGKYKGHSVESIIKFNPEYLLWLNSETDFKLQNQIVKKCNFIINSQKEKEQQEEWKLISASSDKKRLENNLKESVETPYGKAIRSDNGYFDLIDDSGKLSGQVCHWNFGWNKGYDYD